MRQHYLNILGLKGDVSEEEIKKAFRKKALQYHPDKNSHPSAGKEFVKICEAYEKLLSDDTEQLGRTVATPKYYAKRYNKELTPDELKERLRKAKEHAMYKQYMEDNILTLSFEKIKNTFVYKFSNILAVICITLGTTILLDYQILSPKIEKAVILRQQPSLPILETILYNITKDSIVSREYSFFSTMENKNFTILDENALVNVYTTPILRQRVAYSHSSLDYEKAMPNNRNIYMGYWFFQIIFYLPLLNFIFKGPNIVYMVFIHLNAAIPAFGLILFFGGLLFL